MVHFGEQSLLLCQGAVGVGDHLHSDDPIRLAQSSPEKSFHTDQREKMCATHKCPVTILHQ